MPTVVIGNNTGDDYSGTDDNSLEQIGPTNNYGGYSGILLRAHASYSYYMLIKFSGLSSITGPVSVSEASLYLYHYEGEYTATTTLRGLLRNWIEGTLYGDNRSGNTPYSSCYNEYGSGSAWTTAGALGDGTDRDSDSCGTIATNASFGYRQSSDISSIVEDWINGDRSNYGLHGSSSHSSQIRLRSSEGTDGQRPYLTVTYTESGGATGHPTASRFRGIDRNNNVRYA